MRVSTSAWGSMMQLHLLFDESGSDIVGDGVGGIAVTVHLHPILSILRSSKKKYRYMYKFLSYIC